MFEGIEEHVVETNRITVNCCFDQETAGESQRDTRRVGRCYSYNERTPACLRLPCVRRLFGKHLTRIKSTNRH